MVVGGRSECGNQFTPCQIGILGQMAPFPLEPRRVGHDVLDKNVVHQRGLVIRLVRQQVRALQSAP